MWPFKRNTKKLTSRSITGVIAKARSYTTSGEWEVSAPIYVDVFNRFAVVLERKDWNTL